MSACRQSVLAMSVENIKQHGRRAARFAFATNILPFYRAQRGYRRKREI